MDTYFGEVGGVHYKTCVRRSRPLYLHQLEEGDLFTTDDDIVRVVTELQGRMDRSDVTVFYLFVTGDEKGQTDSLTEDHRSTVWLVDFVHAPVF